MTLDLIITHYKSPFSLGKPFFDMVAMQRNINFDDVGVILVNDGEESRLPDELFKDYPYKVTNITVPHGGVSKARNTGIQASKADWVIICDLMTKSAIRWDFNWYSLPSLRMTRICTGRGSWRKYRRKTGQSNLCLIHGM
jgi:glycosyltransferase involved in cell wall biosynthesis